MHKQIKVFFLLMICTACQLSPFDREKPPGAGDPDLLAQPKTGLFISGAGASTFLALPILELLRKEKLSFDVTTGTGWGAWLAAFYAKNQSTDELKWNLFKLQELGFFGSKWFNNKKKQASILQTLTKEALNSPLKTPFFCPGLSKHNTVLWFSHKAPAKAVFHCLQDLPPLFLDLSYALRGARGGGSLFSAGALLRRLKAGGVKTLIWIKPGFAGSSAQNSEKKLWIFWKELSSYLNDVQKNDLKGFSNILILTTKTTRFEVYDFSKLNAIIKTAPTPGVREKVYRLIQARARKTGAQGK